MVDGTPWRVHAGEVGAKLPEDRHPYASPWPGGWQDMGYTVSVGPLLRVDEDDEVAYVEHGDGLGHFEVVSDPPPPRRRGKKGKKDRKRALRERRRHGFAIPRRRWGGILLRTARERSRRYG